MHVLEPRLVPAHPQQHQRGHPSASPVLMKKRLIRLGRPFLKHVNIYQMIVSCKRRVFNTMREEGQSGQLLTHVPFLIVMPLSHPLGLLVIGVLMLLEANYHRTVIRGMTRNAHRCLPGVGHLVCNICLICGRARTCELSSTPANTYETMSWKKR